MTPGLAFFEAGLLRSRNSISILMQCWSGLCILSTLWCVSHSPVTAIRVADGAFRCGRYIIGYTLALGPDVGGVIGDLTHTFFLEVEGEQIGNGTSATHAVSGTIPTTVFASFQMMFSVITPLLITGAFSERVGFGAFCGFIVLWSIIIYYPICK